MLYIPAGSWLYLSMAKRKILVAPLNWGLGHATRCIPIINALVGEGFEPVIASDGGALNLLKNEFPGLISHELSGYNIKYASSAFFFRSKLLLQTPHILKTISAEKKQTAQIIKDEKIVGIISDSRWGVHNEDVPSVFITHQVNVLSGLTTGLSSKIHKSYIKKFDECWVPDVEGDPNLSGIMGHVKDGNLKLKYIGILSRFRKLDLPLKYDIAVILSGPEPQRRILQKVVEAELIGKNLQVVVVEGLIEGGQRSFTRQNITTYNFMLSGQLEEVMNQSSIIICRPGYTSLMDLAALQKSLFIIPTPGQYEQEYLFKKLKSEGLAEGCYQKNFKYDLLKDIEGSNLGRFGNGARFSGSFSLFKGK